MAEPEEGSGQAGEPVDLPPEIAAAWGIRDRPGKGPKRGLSVRAIIDAATRAAVRDGLSAVSMNRVASELGTAAMSLYRYVSGKDELVMLMTDTALGLPPEVPGPGDDWRSGLSTWARRMRAVLLENPWTLRVPVSGPPLTPQQMRWFERGLRCLAEVDLDEGEKVGVILLLSGFVRNEATLAVTLEEGFRGKGETADEVLNSFSRTLRTLLDPEEFPAVIRALDAGIFDQADSEDSDFEFGLERILDGIQALIAAR